MPPAKGYLPPHRHTAPTAWSRVSSALHRRHFSGMLGPMPGPNCSLNDAIGSGNPILSVRLYSPRFRQLAYSWCQSTTSIRYYEAGGGELVASGVSERLNLSQARHAATNPMGKP